MNLRVATDYADVHDACDGHVADYFWHEFGQSRARVWRDGLFGYYQRWLKKYTIKLAELYRYPLADFDDYLQLANIGLLQAIDRFDLSYGVYFRSFAKKHVRGAILNGLGGFSQQHTRSLSTSVTSDDALAEAADWIVQLSLELFADLEGFGFDLPKSPQCLYEREDAQATMRQWVSRLPEQECLVLTLHYYEDVSFTQIAGQLGLSRSRVSQVHQAGLLSLRVLMQREG